MDLVVVGARPAAMAAAIEAVHRGMRVLVVIRSRRARFGGRLRRQVRAAGEGLRRQFTVLTGAEVVCVDGIGSVEAVVIRRIRTGRLIGVNASAVSESNAASLFKNFGRPVQYSTLPSSISYGGRGDTRRGDTKGSRTQT